MIFMHHQPVPVGSRWIDQYVLKNAEAFFELVDQYDTIRAISWGHVHQEFNSQRKGVALIATPSTCVQFEPHNTEFKLDNSMPGYRTYKLFADGCFNSNVNRVEEKHYAIDFASSGY